MELQTTLHHLPYLGDGEHDTFLEAYSGNYEDSTLFEDNGVNDAICNEILLDLASKYMQLMPDVAMETRESTAHMNAWLNAAKPTEGAAMESMPGATVVSPRPSRFFFEFLSHAVGSRIRDSSPRVLREKYDALIRFKKNETNIDGGSASMEPNVDDKSTARENCPTILKLDTYRSLFCRRCFMYECCFHGHGSIPVFGRGEGVRVTI